MTKRRVYLGTLLILIVLGAIAVINNITLGRIGYALSLAIIDGICIAALKAIYKGSLDETKPND